MGVAGSFGKWASMNPSQDTEITLSTGKLLGLFVALVAVCGMLFGLGYSLGRGSEKQASSLVAETATPSSNSASGAAKPGAAQAVTKTADCAAGQNCAPGAQTAQPQDLTFYKAVEQKDANTQLTPQEATIQQNAASAPAKSAPEMAGKVAPAVVLGSGYVVQIAAVSKREDAELLKSALQQKQYPVVVTTLPNDKLFHVQVGPFADSKDAEQMKSRLMSDGYNPIVKR